ncbi:MAG: hypothetical protein QM784_07905 [Polyangiaceae bacterium]
MSARLLFGGATRLRLLPFFADSASRLRTLSVLAIIVVGNLFAARYEHRWDVTTDARYTPSPELARLLRTMPHPTTAFVFLGHGDPLAPSVGQLLSSYANVSSKFVVEWVDPNRDPARFLAKQNELGMPNGTDRRRSGHDRRPRRASLVDRRKVLFDARGRNGTRPRT